MCRQYVLCSGGAGERRSAPRGGTRMKLSLRLQAAASTVALAIAIDFACRRAGGALARLEVRRAGRPVGRPRPVRPALDRGHPPRRRGPRQASRILGLFRQDQGRVSSAPRTARAMPRAASRRQRSSSASTAPNVVVGDFYLVRDGRGRAVGLHTRSRSSTSPVAPRPRSPTSTRAPAQPGCGAWRRRTRSRDRSWPS